MIDESHVTIPQLGGMYRGDRSRKENLVEYGFRLPSALDNRPLRFDEFERLAPQTLFISATPGPYENEHAGAVVEQVIRPTGLVDPAITVLPAAHQVDDLLVERGVDDRERLYGYRISGDRECAVGDILSRTLVLVVADEDLL